MVVLYWDCGSGVNILQSPAGEIFLHHLLQNVLIGPLISIEEAHEIAQHNGWRN